MALGWWVVVVVETILASRETCGGCDRSRVFGVAFLFFVCGVFAVGTLTHSLARSLMHTHPQPALQEESL